VTSFPNSPRLLKGAIVGVDEFNPLASLILFQYNPETLTRSLRARTPERANWWERPARTEKMRLAGPPEEEIQLEIEIDATDQMERADPATALLGIHPALASLEMLLYPKALSMITSAGLLEVGLLEADPPEAPLTLFVWGINRVLPVRITGFSITEQAFGPGLNPIRASVSLSLTVLNYQDLELTSPGGALFMAHQIAKEAMATFNSLSNVASAASSVAASLPGV
jgi:hypothetical protein